MIFYRKPLRKISKLLFLFILINNKAIFSAENDPSERRIQDLTNIVNEIVDINNNLETRTKSLEEKLRNFELNTTNAGPNIRIIAAINNGLSGLGGLSEARQKNLQETLVNSGNRILENGIKINLDNARLQQSGRIIGKEISKGMLGIFGPLTAELTQLMQDARRRPHIAILKIAGATAAMAMAIYSTKIFYKLASDYLMTPHLEIKRTESIFQQISNKIKGIKPSIASIDDLSLDPEIKEQLTRYESSLVQSISHDVELPNAILMGPPGTGKTYAVEAIAQKNGLTFVKMSGSSFKKYPKAKAIAVMDQLFSWAHRKGGVVIFIDEIENLLASREGEHASSGDFDILNNFLAHTGTRSKRFAIIGTTNVPNLLDAAMGRRFDEMIEFKLPGLGERTDMLNQYVKKILLSQKIGITIQNEFLNPDYVSRVAEKTDRLSGGELEGIIVRARQVALSTPGKVLTPEMFSKLVDESIKKHNRLVSKTTKTNRAA